MNLPFNTIREIVLELRKSRFSDFNALPYNRFTESGIDSSERWWLCPTKDKLGFAHGKVVATAREHWVEDGKVFVGFNVEKGILYPAIKGDGYVLKDNWLWHEFVRNAALQLGRKLGKASEALDSSVEIVVTCATEPQHAGQGERGDVLKFESDGVKLERVLAPERLDYLTELAESHTFEQFGAALETLTGKGFGYRWVDLMIGSHFTMDPAGPNHVVVATTMLEPFREWMLASK